MRSRIVCRSGGWLLLITSLLISHHTNAAARRKHETVYVADPAGLPLSKPSNVPAKVGSPAELIQPDRYEFYTFDESGELIKRLMTLQEIQEIIATGDGDDGHILTIAQSDIDKPAVTFNFQPPSHTKVHSIVSNVQNVLKSEMEAQKNNPPKDGMFDTPDVSSSWSQILPAIFGNTGGNIAPDSLLSHHVGAETDFITINHEQPTSTIDSPNVEKISNEKIKEKIQPFKPNTGYDLVTKTNIQESDLLSGEVLESKTTVSEIFLKPTKYTNPTTESTKSNVKNNPPTTLKVQTTEKIITKGTSVLQDKPTSTKTTSASIKHTTTTYNRPTTAPSKPTTNSSSPTTNSSSPTTVSPKITTTIQTSTMKQTTARIPVKDTTVAQTKEQTPIKASTPFTSKPTNYIQINQSTPVTTDKPTSLVTRRPIHEEHTQTSPITASTYKEALITQKEPITSTVQEPSKVPISTTKVVTPTLTKQTTKPPIVSTSSSSTTQSTTEKQILTSSATKLQTNYETTEKSVSQKLTTASRPATTLAPKPTSEKTIISTKPDVSQYQTTATVKPKPESPKPEFTTTRPVQSSTENINVKSSTVNKTPSITEPEYTHVKISSSNGPASSSALPTPQKLQTTSHHTSTTAYQRPTITATKTTTEKIKISPTTYTTEKLSTAYTKPEIDINQIINQIALNLGDSQQFDHLHHNTASTFLPSTSNNHLIKEEITTYRPNIVKISEQTSTPKIHTSTFQYTTTKKNYNNNVGNFSKKEEVKISTTPVSPTTKAEIKFTTERISEISNPTKPSVTKPSSELSDSITNLLSQIADPKPTIVPIQSLDKKTTIGPSYQVTTKRTEQQTSIHEIKPSTPFAISTSQNTGLHNTGTNKPTETTKSPPRTTEKLIPSTNKLETSTIKIDKITLSTDFTNKVTQTTQKLTTQSANKVVSDGIHVPNGHYITRVSSIEKPTPTTNKYEIYKTSNSPTTTSIKKIIVPEISTHKTLLLSGEILSNTNNNDKPLKISLLPENDSIHFDDNIHDKPDSSDDFNEDATYDGSDLGSTHDDELMEMLNKYSEMFNSAPDAESKSGETEDEDGIQLFDVKKGTSYKKTDVHEDDFDSSKNITSTENILHIKESLTTNNVPTKHKDPIVSTKPTVQVTTEKGKIDKPVHNTSVDSETQIKNQVKVEINKEKIDKTPIKSEHKIVHVEEKPIIKTPNIFKASTEKIQVVHKNTLNSQPPNLDIIKDSEVHNINYLSTPVLLGSTIIPHKTISTERTTEKFVVTKQSTIKNIVTDSLPQKTENVHVVTEKYTKINAGEIKNSPATEHPIVTSTKNDVQHVPKPAQQTQKVPHIPTSTTENILKNKNVENKVVVTTNSQSNEKISTINSWTLVSTASPHKELNRNKSEPVHLHLNHENNDRIQLIGHLHLNNDGEGLERTTSGLNEDVYQFTGLCNELGFKYWQAITSYNIDPKRSIFISPFAITSMLSMIFMATRGATSEEMNEILKLDDMVTFNPHIVFKNVTESIEVSQKAGVATSAIVRELYSDRAKGRLLSFYKDRAQKFYSGHVEEINFSLIGDVVRRRTNLLVKRQTWSRIPEYIKHNNLVMRSPLAVFSANIFQTDCSAASTEGRDGEMYFVVSPTIRQRRLVPVPAVVYRSGFLAGYVTELDATVVALGKGSEIVSTILAMPGQHGSIARGDDIIDLEKRLIESAIREGTWRKLLKSLIPRSGLELQIPRLSHRSIINGSTSLQTLGLKDLFDPQKANLAGLNGQDNDLHLSDIILDNTFTTCGEGFIGGQHHIETYPGEINKLQRRLWRNPHRPLYPGEVPDSWEDLRDYQRAFHDPLHDMSLLSIPLHLRPRQARVPDSIIESPRLKFDRPFLYFVRHNPTGLILHMGRYNPRLLP